MKLNPQYTPPTPTPEQIASNAIRAMFFSRQYDGVVPVVIGEWSLGLQGNVYAGLNTESIELVRRAFGNAQLNEYENAFGWFFWNYKLSKESTKKRIGWSFRDVVSKGYLPNKISKGDNL